jgi:hypothetical protein
LKPRFGQPPISGELESVDLIPSTVLLEGRGGQQIRNGMIVLERTWRPGNSPVGREMEMPRGLKKSAVLGPLFFDNERFEVPIADPL